MNSCSESRSSTRETPPSGVNIRHVTHQAEESLGNAQAMRADLASIAPIAQGEGVPEDGLDQAWEAHRPARGRLQ